MSDLLRFLESKNITYRLSDKHVKSGWVGLECPFCGLGSGKFHYGINLTSLRSSCWRCSFKDTVRALQVLAHVDYRVATDLCKAAHSYQVPQVPHGGSYKPPLGRGPLQPPHRQYLQSRGLDPDYVEKIWGVQGIGLASKLQWRIFIPIHDQSGTAVS